MALGREDHKRIALGIAAELKKVLGDHNGKRLLDRHSAKHQTTEMPPEADHEDADDGGDLDEVMSSMVHGSPPPHQTTDMPKPKAKVPYGRKC